MRKLMYHKADVFVAVFSLLNAGTLDNLISVWLPEV